MDNEKQPGNVIATLSVVAEAEVIPAENAELLWSSDPITNYEVKSEHGPELVHFKENDE